MFPTGARTPPRRRSEPAPRARAPTPSQPLRSGGGAFDLGDVGLDLRDVGLEPLALELLGSPHRPLDLRAHVGDGDDDEAGRALVELLAELLEVVAAHPRRGVARDGAEDR